MNVGLSVILVLVIYMPFHLFEEAIGDFPMWMYVHRWLPYHMSHGHWIANNVFIYYLLLLCATGLYFFDSKQYLCCGIAVLLWGIINFVEHWFFTIKDRKVSPGIVTGVIFLVNSINGLINVMKLQPSTITIVLAFIIGGILFGSPIGLSVLFYRFFEKYIKIVTDGKNIYHYWVKPAEYEE